MSSDLKNPKRKWRHRSTRLSKDVEVALLTHYGSRASTAREAAKLSTEYGVFTFYGAMRGQASNDRVIDFLNTLYASIPVEKTKVL